jgi:carboxy-cis,cis-muconate cyclase
VSYDAADPYDIKVEAKIVAGSLCSGSKSIFVNAFQQPPYSMHGNYYYGDARCSTVMSGHENGTLKEVIQEYVYAADSAVHGTAITPNGLFLLSADTKANLIWFHAIDGATGLLSNLTSIAGPSEGSGPRHAVVHTSGDFLYVVLEEASEATNYYIFPGGSLMLVGSHYELLKVEDPSDYWADEISLSIDNKYLWATTRARNNSQKGHISAFELNAGGAIEKHMFLLETSTSGGFANSVEASPFNISIAALTDNSTGFVDIWDVGGGMIAHLAIPDGQGCCANAVLVGLIKSKRIWGRLVH